ncbi:hypothetical protein BOX15_Mlig006949g1 [Macrostomum lignano]|uniref:CBM21 domain-containing protein n=1 Tax=Macrostomum lignano TaxID=282301 RepID=A0A267EGN7_9PLAT|nr:hypothetical protein BOX15_Mlig006949g1 [Macrostomum lignano]
MHRYQLSPIHRHQRSLAAASSSRNARPQGLPQPPPAVKFCLALGESPSPNASAFSLSSLSAADEAPATMPRQPLKRFLEPPRPVTMTTCCQAECKTGEGSSQNGLSQADNRQKQQQQLRLVYCENSLSRFRPPPRRTLSFPPPIACSTRALPILVQPLECLAAASPDQADTAKFTASPTPSPIVLTESPTHAGCRRRADRRRRRVRFADALGFELTNVRVVVCDPEEPPVIPGHVLKALRRQMSLRAAGANYERQWDDDYGFGFEEGAVAERAAGVDKPPKPAPLGYSTCWRPLFSTQPPTDAVERRVADEKIAMESVRLETMALEASVQVQNLGPVKQVWLRLTDSSWRHHTDLHLQFANQLADGAVDRFTLRTCLPISAFESQRLEFALGFRVEGVEGEFWDNNSGFNYAFERLPQLHRARALAID